MEDFDPPSSSGCSSSSSQVPQGSVSQEQKNQWCLKEIQKIPAAITLLCSCNTHKGSDLKKKQLQGHSFPDSKGKRGIKINLVGDASFTFHVAPLVLGDSWYPVDFMFFVKCLWWPTALDSYALDAPCASSVAALPFWRFSRCKKHSCSPCIPPRTLHWGL